MTLPPEWHALGREAELAAEQLATGVTLLGRANHAQKGLYNQAFFALSIGFERLAKLTLVADHAIENKGAWLTDQKLRKFGHNIGALLQACEPIPKRIGWSGKWCERPNLPIHSAIIARLSEFSEMTRYYNLASLSGGQVAHFPEPIGAWWRDVGEPILACHYNAGQRARDEAQARAMGTLMGSDSFVLHHDESSQEMTSVEATARRSGTTRLVQNYGRLYVMQLVRWLSCIISKLSHKGAYEERIKALLGLEESFSIFQNEDKYLLGRKAWSIYRR